MSSYKPHQKSFQKLFIIYLILLSLSLTFLALSFNTKPLITNPSSSLLDSTHDWFHYILSKKINTKKIKIGLVNVNNDITTRIYDAHELVEAVSVNFDHISNNNIRWEDFFPEWIDEDQKWGAPRCPEIPLPRLEDYGGLDVVVARVPCGGNNNGGGSEGIRDVFRLQVNLVVANLVVANGWVKPDINRTVYVVFMGSCGPMQEIFRCDDLLSHVGDYWVYKPDLKKLKQKLLMPVGSCQIAPAYAQTGDEIWRPRVNPNLKRKIAYATVLHSSEAYVCGAIALAQSIIQTNSTKALILLHDSSITPKSLRGLRAAGWKTKLIEPIRSPSAKKGSYNEWNYSKLRVWQLTKYDKIIFIDADIVVLKNIDEFFTYPQLSASGNDKSLFNSGIMVIEPSECMFQDLMSKTRILASYNGGDQGFLNEAFTWWHRLPKKLNYLKVYRNRINDNHREIPNHVYAVHLLGLKPWVCYKDYDCNWDKEDHQIFASDSAHKRWWHVYEAMPKKLQKFCGLTKQMDSRIRKWRGIAQKLGLADEHWKLNAKDPRQYHFVDM
ncbi:putative UDP-glucuronate:xylan alpha-glucuronosyltransferase 4 [Mercurialis annua]|uniref:putative UDP-glucuronate:xylan alpha-glucuronosyltransferase 4 n=1 Tax=Mercurialis annua TaxID=3986 RepID=UPI00215F356A|nr:putative UDP-glucuronate:xylan alpha-glucuronosyltransferase 4 [Mercurialis annua]